MVRTLILVWISAIVPFINFLRNSMLESSYSNLCAMDIIMSKYGNLGLHRTKTLVNGDNICDFRYKAGKDTKVASKVIK